MGKVHIKWEYVCEEKSIVDIDIVKSKAIELKFCVAVVVLTISSLRGALEINKLNWIQNSRINVNLLTFLNLIKKQITFIKNKLNDKNITTILNIFIGTI